MLLTIFVSIFSILLPSLISAQPGAPWTEEEVLIVKAKLYAIFQQKTKVSKEYLGLHPELGLKEWPESHSLPNAAKFLRYQSYFNFVFVKLNLFIDWVFISV